MMRMDAAGGLIAARDPWNGVANYLIVNFCAEDGA